MAKSSTGHGGPQGGLDAQVDRVLADGEARDLDVRHLIDLIHRVNPSMMSLPPAQTRKRYRQKSALQSLLIRRFKEDLVVDLDSTEEVVGLSHRRLPVDACHAPIDSLDDDARAWVRLQLDIKAVYHADVAGKSAESSAPREADTSALGLARSAVDAFDYPLAREHFEAALAEHAGAARVAVPFLELLVDTLAADEDALSLEPRLEARALQHPTVRGLLSLAAARVGKAARALELSAGAEGHGAQALTILADAAFARDDSDEVQSLLQGIAELDPVYPDRFRLREALASLRARARAPLEASLAQALERGNLSAAEDLAEQILATWPESLAARRAMKEVDERQRRARVDAAIERGAQAEAAGELEKALALLRGARDEEPGREELERRVGDLERRLREGHDSAAVARVERLLRESVGDGLEAYVELSPPLRLRVEVPSTRVHRARIDQLRPDRDRARAASRAVLAFEEALALEATGANPSRILAVIGSHREVLSQLSEVGQLFQRLDAQERERRATHLRQALAEADQAVASRDFPRARRLLDSVPQDTPGVEALLGRIEAVESRERLLASLEVLEEELRPLQARRVLDELMHGMPEAEQVPWLEHQKRLDLQVRAIYQLRAEALSGGEPESFIARRGELFHQVDAVATLLNPRGNLINVEAHGAWLFIEEVELAGQRVVNQISLCARFHLGSFWARLDGHSLWVISERGGVLEIGLEAWELRRARSLLEIVPSDAVIEEVLVARGGRYLWVMWAARDRSGSRFETIDTATWKSIRSSAGHQLAPVPGCGESLVAQLGRLVGGTLHTPSGAASRQLGPLSNDWRYRKIATHPDGSRWVALVVDPKRDDDEHKTEQPFLGLLAAGQTSPVWVSDSGSANPHGLAASGAAGAVYAYMDVDWDRLLIGWNGTGQELFRVKVSPELRLTQDTEAKTVVALSPSEHGWIAVGLGNRAPSFPENSEPQPRRPLPLTVPLKCSALDLNPDPNGPDVEQFMREEARKHQHDKVINLDPLDIVRTFLGAYNIIRINKRPEAPKQWDELLAKHGQAGIIRLYQAHDLVTERRWDELEPLIRGIDTGLLRPAEICHVHHLRGVLKFRAGDFAGAAVAWKEGLPLEVHQECGLAEAIRVAESLSGSPSAHPFGKALAEGDRLLTAGDTRGARAALDQPAVHGAREVQTMARLVEASLAQEPTDPAERFRIHKLLAHYLELVKPVVPTVPDNLPLPNRWDEVHLAELQRRAEAWLEVNGGP